MKFSFLVILFLFALISCKQDKDNDVFIFCDAEETIDGEFITQENTISGGDYQSNESSKSGEYSLKLDKTHPYGFAYTVKNIKKGDVIKIATWKTIKSDFGSIVLDVVDNEINIRNSHIIKVEGDWGLIESYFYANNDHDLVKIFAYNPDSIPVYFDDYSIDIYKNTKKPKNIEDALVINIPASAMDSIRTFRNKALTQGVITSDLKRYFKGEIDCQGEKIPIKLRLKGDWTDHLKSDKWSFRIKVRGNHSFDGLKSFSIQNPSTRGFMYEWFAHQLYEKEDVLTTTYKFIPVIINGVNKGVYALEEHFDKQLLESRDRREAPIVKFDEGGVWQNHFYRITNLDYLNVPLLASAEILPFKKSRTYRTETLNRQFKVAAQKMNQYRNQNDLLEDCFNEDAIAKYLALTDLINGKHSLIWHNQRFYFNPITSQLEPIAYDCFTSLSELEYYPRIIGAIRFNKENLSLSEYILKNPKIEEKYYTYLKKFISDEYIEKALEVLQKDISKNSELLKNEYPFADLNVDFFKFNQKELSAQLKKYENNRKKKAEPTRVPVKFDKMPENVLFPKVALSAYTEKRNELSTVISLKNYHSSPIEIIGTLSKGQRLDSFTPLKRTLKLKEYSKKTDYFEVEIHGVPRRLVYKAENCGDSIFTKKISKWPKPQNPSKVNYSFLSDTIVFKKGEYSYSTDLIIPRDRIVLFEEGVSMNFTQHAAFVSYSPVIMNGTEEEPIRIYSSDSTASGFTIIANHEEVKMNYCFFNGFSSMNKNNWILTGAVTIYEGEVELDNCHFENNHCEDALNIIRSHFVLRNCTVKNTTSDGFDADFCTGTVNDSYFYNTGNDCIDFSGSSIEIDHCVISESGDKGISGGEKSTLIVRNTSISNSTIGIASKDSSKVSVYSVKLKNCKYAFAAYRKKPEFGPAEIIVYSIVENKTEQLFLLEKDSKLNYMNEEYVGENVFNIDSMYVQFSK